MRTRNTRSAVLVAMILQSTHGLKIEDEKGGCVEKGVDTNDSGAGAMTFAFTLHDPTYGITSDSLTQLACILSALIHDVDHVGVPACT